MGSFERLEVGGEAVALGGELLGHLGVDVVEHRQRLRVGQRLAALAEVVAQLLGLGVEVYLKRNGMADQEFFDAVAAEADDLGHTLREGCKAMPDPAPMSMFDHVYVEETEELRQEREGYAAYLESFEGAH